MNTTSATEKDHGYEPESKLWKQVPQQAAGYKPSAVRDCSTYQLRYASLSELEFQQ